MKIEKKMLRVNNYYYYHKVQCTRNYMVIGFLVSAVEVGLLR